MSTGSEIAEPDHPLQSASSRSLWQLFTEWLTAIACALTLLLALGVCMMLILGSGSAHHDFPSYWASGQLLVHHRNPYDADAIRGLEVPLGFNPQHQVLIVRNLPSALMLMAPLGFVSYRAAVLLWSVALAGCWIFAIRTLWVAQGRIVNRISILGVPVSPTFLLLFFAPALTCLLVGQTGIFALLGLALFVRFQRSWPFLAGVSLWLCALKPHLFLPLAVVLLLWVIVSRRYRVLAGAAVALGASSALTALLDPSAWFQYSRMMQTIGIENEFIPCPAIALRFAIDPRAAWLQYVPAAVGCAWAAWYFWRRREGWDWVQDGALLALVSMLVSPYAWLTDQVLAAPACIVALYRASRGSLLAFVLMGVAFQLEVLGIEMHSALFLWTAPAWFAWYLWVMRPWAARDGLSQPTLGDSPNSIAK